MKSGQWTAVLLSGMATALAMPAAHAGWVTPSLVSPPPVPTPCNPETVHHSNAQRMPADGQLGAGGAGPGIYPALDLLGADHHQ